MEADAVSPLWGVCLLDGVVRRAATALLLFTRYGFQARCAPPRP